MFPKSSSKDWKAIKELIISPIAVNWVEKIYWARTWKKLKKSWMNSTTFIQKHGFYPKSTTPFAQKKLKTSILLSNLMPIAKVEEFI